MELVKVRLVWSFDEKSLIFLIFKKTEMFLKWVVWLLIDDAAEGRERLRERQSSLYQVI